MNRAKELVLREYDDTGAATLEKNWAQIEYTAYWCIHLLMPLSGIVGVIPEGIDDVSLILNGCYELHQVKCRDESQPPWTTAEVLPILCNQYCKRRAFSKPCTFHFVSDHLADTRTQFKPGNYGELYRLKYLLDIEHEGQRLTPNEENELSELEGAILPRIVSLISSQGESIDLTVARELLHDTWIDTKSLFVRNRPVYDELARAIAEALPSQPACSMPQLYEIYSRLLLLIVGKIIRGKSLADRTITRQEVLDCRIVAITPEPNLPDLNTIVGNTVAAKKALLGGFDATEVPAFALQMNRAREKRRRLESLGLNEKLDDLTLALLTLQGHCRRTVSKPGSDSRIGAEILAMLQLELRPCINMYFPNNTDIDEPFCHGLIWLVTNECHLWWHKSGAEVQQT